MAKFIRRSRTSAVAVVGSRRQTAWAFGTVATAITNLAAASKVLISTANATLLAARPFTIVRVRGILSVQSDSTAATRTTFGAFGIAIVSDTAAALGITAVPDPVTDEASGLWFVYQHWLAGRTFVTAAGIQGSEDWSQYEIDSKAMRKVDEGSDTAVVLANKAAVGGVNFVLQWRMLIKLH